MNRSRLNGRVLGAGNRSSAVRLAVAEVLQLVGALRVSVIKYGSAATDLALESSMRLRQRVPIAFTAVAEVVGELSGHVQRRVYGATVEYLALVSSIKASAIIRLSGVIDSVLDSVVGVTQLHRVHSPVVGIASLESELNGSALYSGPAPDDRTAVIPADVRFVAIPGSENSTGV